MIVVDSSVWIGFFGGMSTPEVERLDGLLGVTPLAIGDLYLGGGDARVPHRPGCRHRPTAVPLRRKGITVRKTIDGIIATACIEANLPLLFSDRDFQPYVDHLGLEVA